MKRKRARQPSSGARRRGYTLVEMLVTIAIIAVLAALMFPAVKAYQSSAHRTQCVANLKQLSMAAATYMADNGGLIPAPVNNRQPDAAAWLTSLKKILGISTAAAGRAKPSAMCCPAARREYNASNYPDTYGMNNNLQNGNQQIRIQQVTRPSKTALLMDGQLAQMPPYWRFTVTHAGNFPKERDFVHNGSINILFIDGHVENRKEAEIPRTQSDPFWSYNAP